MDPTKLYLAQTDTTVGFLSQDSQKLAHAKRRPSHKPFLIEVDGFKQLQKFVRVPKSFKKLVRRSKRTTFVYPNGKALRVVKDPFHLWFLRRFGWMYSTSANISGAPFDPEVALKLAEIVVEDERGLYEGAPSKIVKLSKKRLRRLR